MDIKAVRGEFQSLDGSLFYLDNAATTLKPDYVIEKISNFYAKQNGSPHRGAHKLSILATELYDKSKKCVGNFINLGESGKIVYTRGTTEGLNLIAGSLPEGFIGKGDKIVITITSHHSNILPWQRLAKKTSSELHYIYCDNYGNIPEEEYSKIDNKTKIVSFPLISNGIGSISPAKDLIKKAKSVGAMSIVDCAQTMGHIPVDFQDLDCDFLAFSGHKMYASQGIGVLAGKLSSFEKLEPFNMGGDMIEFVTEQSATFAEIPTVFEAGTQNVAGAVGLMAAINWMEKIGYDNIYKHDKKMTELLLRELSRRPEITIYGPPENQERGSLVTFNVKGVHPHDVATILDNSGVAIRAGHHCCQPLMTYLQTKATCRASIGIYNNEEDIQALIRGLENVKEVFSIYA